MTGPVDGTTDCPVLVQSAERPTAQCWLCRQNVRFPGLAQPTKRQAAQGWLSRQTSDCPGLAQPTKRQTSQDTRSKILEESPVRWAGPNAPITTHRESHGGGI